MRNLLNFLLNYGYWLLFLLLEVASFLLLFRFNNYQGSVGFTSANRVVGYIYTVSSEVSVFFKLRTINEQLTRENVNLQAENKVLRETLKQALPDAKGEPVASTLQEKGYNLIPTHIINNSLHLPDNYITLDKGASDGVAPEMGVVNGNGVVGIVYMVSEHYALAISLLNSKSSISCRFKHNDYFGYLKWKGGSSQHALLEDVPRHALFPEGRHGSYQWLLRRIPPRPDGGNRRQHSRLQRRPLLPATHPTGYRLCQSGQCADYRQ